MDGREIYGQIKEGMEDEWKRENYGQINKEAMEDGWKKELFLLQNNDGIQDGYKRKWKMDVYSRLEWKYGK